MEEKDKIDILLKEYDTLRAEIIHRLTSRFAFLGLFGAVGGYGFFMATSLTNVQKFALFITGLFLFAVWLQLGTVIARCSKRIAEVEQLVNELSGEKLMVWETEHRGSKVFHFFHK